MNNATNATHPIIVIIGPTGVGKSDFALQLAAHIEGEIVNADLGQLYTPLTIGTAKPLWRQEKIPHHGFDLLDEPIDYNVIQYRTYVQNIIENIQQRGKVPLIVGGSSFYWNTLFYPPSSTLSDRSVSDGAGSFLSGEGENEWNVLHDIDPQRAYELHPHDHYRISRALSLWRMHGVLPSSMKPSYTPLREKFLIIATTRPRRELGERIDLRVDQMLQAGWAQEALQLDAAWHEFLLRKKFIGYDDIIRESSQYISLLCRDRIKQRTRQYAKRQETYWRSWKKKFEFVAHAQQKYYELSLTLSSFDLYIKQLHHSLNDIGLPLS